MTDETRSSFRRWLWSPPRPHGEIIPDRTVSFLELFYDLVYVAVITRRLIALPRTSPFAGPSSSASSLP